MRRYRLFLLLVLLVGGGVSFFLWLRKSEISRSETSQSDRTRPEGLVFKQDASKPQGPRYSLTTTNGIKQPSDKALVQSYVRQVQVDRLYDWKRRIDFYGKVVDEHHNPLEGANVHFVCTDLSAEGTSKAVATSDSNGVFSLLGRTGKRLSVKVSKDGYYSTQSSGMSFEYADPSEGMYTPDPRRPVVFSLRKKGESQRLISHYVKVPLARDDSVVKFDLLTGQVSPFGQLEIQAWASPERDSSSRYDWRIVLRVPHGGLLETNEEFPFLAPDQGYAQSVRIEMSKFDEKWHSNIEKQFYVVFGEPCQYGRIKIRSKARGASLFMDYWVNPSGGRNLE